MKKIILISILLFIIACDTERKNLKAIDDIELGMTEKEFKSQLDSLNIPKKGFITKVLITSNDEYVNNLLHANYTKLFNSSPFNNGEYNHWGILVPEKYDGTDNIVQLNVLLVHAGRLMALGKNGIKSFSENDKDIFGEACEQYVRTDFIDYVGDLYIKNYGNPKDSTSVTEYPYYWIKGENKKEYQTDGTYNGDLLEWETDALIIKFFKGIKVSDVYYDKLLQGYIFPLTENKNSQNEFEENEDRVQVTKFAYISYRIKDDIIHNLKLDKMSL